MAHLAEHRQGVNQLAVAGNGLFFASASSDETVKVWDCRRLEKDVSFKSRLTYTSQGETSSAGFFCLVFVLMAWQKCVKCETGKHLHIHKSWDLHMATFTAMRTTATDCCFGFANGWHALCTSCTCREAQHVSHKPTGASSCCL